MAAAPSVHPTGSASTASSAPLDPRIFTATTAEDGSRSCLAGTIAGQADALAVYEEAVQTPLIECHNIESLYYGAQDDDSDRPDARVLREDFCSSAAVAWTWLGLDKSNTSQGVDIDLAALKRTRARLGTRRVALIDAQGPLEAGAATEGGSGGVETAAQASTSVLEGSASGTWAPGAASDRFERRLQKKRAKETKQRQGKPSAVAASQPITSATGGSEEPSSSSPSSSSSGSAPRMTLVHADVLSLPLPSLVAPDVVASLNYALCYFHDRPSMVAYLRQVRSTLRPSTGVLICDQFLGPMDGDEAYPPQDELWGRFEEEPGFKRGPGDPPSKLDGKRPMELKPMSDGTDGTPGYLQWPRGKLKLVRKGQAEGGFEYWREDGPVDWQTNRFRMSLSFRFRDGSWLRDVFSYDFRIWSLKEIVEAMEEVGLVNIQTHVVPRNSDSVPSNEGSARSRSSSSASSSSSAASLDGVKDEHLGAKAHPQAQEDEDEDDMVQGLGRMLRRTEKEERDKVFYHRLDKAEKVFATRSFGAYIVARAPPAQASSLLSPRPQARDVTDVNSRCV